jgi:glycosyltransferase involved in cell wall biosynthesis
MPLLRLPVIYEVHALNHWTNPIFTNKEASPGYLLRLKKREQYVYERALRLVAISGGCRAALLSAFHVPFSVDVIPDGTPIFIPPESKREGFHHRLLYIGQFYPWKGVETAVCAMARLPGFTLDLYGGDYFTAESDIRRLRAISEECGSAAALAFKGFVPPGKLRDVLSGSYIGILPAADNVMGRHFISPLKLFEYMGSSIPVVASDLPPIREVITHGRNGLLFRPGDPSDLARQVSTLAADAALRDSITRQAFADAQEFSYPKRAGLILKVIADSLDR